MLYFIIIKTYNYRNYFLKMFRNGNRDSSVSIVNRLRSRSPNQEQETFLFFETVQTGPGVHVAEYSRPPQALSPRG
jgi:hypothetical protein